MTSNPPSTTTAKDPPQAHNSHTPDESSIQDNPQRPKLLSQLSPLTFKPILPLPLPSACTRASYTPLYLVVPQEFGALDLARGRTYAGDCGGCYDKWRDRQMRLWMEYHQAEWYEGERLKGSAGAKEGERLPGIERALWETERAEKAEREIGPIERMEKVGGLRRG